MTGKILHSTCLRPTYSLRRQLIVSYGITAALTIIIVVFCATLSALRAGEYVNAETSDRLNQQLNDRLEESAFHTAHVFTKKFEHLRGSAALLTEIVRDRIVGYPEFFEDDEFVPFIDRDTGQRKYPLKGKSLPKDFELIYNLNDTNLEEQTQERSLYLREFMDSVSTRDPFLFFQGNCDPSETDSNAKGYFSNCTDANNDPSLGGVLHPTKTLPALVEKANDIALFLRPLWEAEPNIVFASVYFSNEGRGLTLTFPAFSLESQAQYVSAGCDWMANVNPYTSAPFGTKEDIAKCHPEGDFVPIREYNPMERQFCQDQALNPEVTRIYGPYPDATWGQWRVTVGQAVFDRRTGHFIACTGVDLNIQLASEMLKPTMVNNRTTSAITIIDGTVVAGADWSPESDTKTVKIWETGFIDKATFDRLAAAQDWDEEWDPRVVKQKIQDIFSDYMDTHDGVISMHYSPVLPDKYDENYHPDFIIFLSTNSGDVSGVLNSTEDNVNYEIQGLITNIVVIGTIGLIIFLIIVLLVSRILTRPLNWMEMTSWRIVNHADQRVSFSSELMVDEQGKEDPLGKCSPKTEIRDLVAEFQTMIRGFSGQGAAKVAHARIGEVRNVISWKMDFSELYQMNQTMEERLKEEMKQDASLSFGRRLSLRMNSSSRATTSRKPDLGITSLNSVSEVSQFSQVSQASDDDAFRSTEIRTAPNGFSLGRGDSYTTIGNKTSRNTRANVGTNLPADGGNGEVHELGESVRMSRSSLFRWVLVSLLLPLLVTIIVICTLVALDLLNSFPKSIANAEIVSKTLEVDALRDSTALWAYQAEQVLPGALRDLHLLTRMTGWLLFDAVNRTDSFTDIEMEFVEECKMYSNDQTCPYETNDTRSPCSCTWNDPWERECKHFSLSSSRYLQKNWWMCQARDYDEETGERKRSLSFPGADYSPATTAWWANFEGMPGAEKGNNASGYTTTYDRLRVASAVAAVSFPIYNHVNIDRTQTNHSSMSSYVAFEADGAFMGFAGCNHDFARYSRFLSSDMNNAYKINPLLCPVGKYGYDPRCREWYTDTKVKSAEGISPVHVTGPYHFATSDQVGTSAGSALVDPRTGEFVGTTLIDVATSKIFQNPEATDADFVFVITPGGGPEGDTVIGPDHKITDEPIGIADVMLPFDPPGSPNRLAFAEIIKKMKDGISGEESFTRKNDEGGKDEIHVSFAPIYARVLNPVRPDDYYRGSNASQILLYSVGMAKYAHTTEYPFQEVGDDIEEKLERLTIIFLSAIGVVTFFSLLTTAQISIAVTKPMMILLQAVKRVNAGGFEDDIPPLPGGSREVNQVYTSFAKLYKIVRMSNASFFAGNYKWALHIAMDALKLFQKIGDEKAIAIACNNIGNTLLALAVQCREKSGCLMVDGRCCVQMAIEYFDEAISIGTREFETSEDDATKAGYAQQLADRHFNRAMLLFYSLDDPCCPEGAKDSAMTDLFRCREYDRGVQEYFLHEKLMFRYCDLCFERIIRRLHGLGIMYSMEPKVWQVWDVNELVDGADLMLQAAWDQENAPLFRDIGKVGRLQQLEGAVIGLELTSGKLEEGARLAMRMFVEDEFIIDSSFALAADSLMRYMKDPKTSPWAPDSTLQTNLELGHMRRAGKQTALDMERTIVFCLEFSDKISSAEVKGGAGPGGILGLLNEELMAFYDDHFNERDSIGVVALNSTADVNLVVPMSQRKEETEKGEIVSSSSILHDPQRELLDKATKQAGARDAVPALPAAVDMVLNAASKTTGDVFMIYISDGCKYDKRSFAKVHKKIKKSVKSRRSASVEVIAIGLLVEDDDFLEGCRNLCLATKSRHSKYLSASDGAILGDVFRSAGRLLSASTGAESNRLQLALTMERF